MKRRHIVSLIFAAFVTGGAFAWPMAAHADDDNDGSSGQGSDDDTDDDEDNSGHGSSDDGGNEDENKDEDDDHNDDHVEAREAVERDDAIPLRDMLEIFGRYGNYTVVDVSLAHRMGALEYRIKFIDSDGRVRRATFDARTGALVP